MQKVILDTNVVVSALIQQSFPYLIMMDVYLERKIRLCVSGALITEYFEVLNRSKFSKFPDFKIKAESVLTDMANHAEFYSPSKSISLIKDPDDNMLLELADECKANFLITGNTNDFSMHKFKKTKIITPREYWEKYKP